MKMTLYKALVPSALLCVALMGCGGQPAATEATDTASEQTTEATATEAAPDVAAGDYMVTYSNSELFTQEDEKAAVDVVMAEFNTWEGCTMKELAIADDATCAGQLEYANSLRDAETPEFDQALVITSTFHSPAADQVEGTAWEADKDYTDWNWTLARTNGGAWTLLTWGYA